LLQDDLYRPNHYQSLMEFRAQTLERLKKFANQRFFKTEDYLKGVALQAAQLW
jgi:acyl-CoA oxidase